MINFTIKPGSPLTGNVRVPSDKSMSHRALMLAAIAEGDSEIDGLLEAEDIFSTLNILTQLGIRHEAVDEGYFVIKGKGLQGLEGASSPLDCGNSGTSMRLLAGLLAGQRFDSVLVGDDSLSQRPMTRIVEPLQQMGAKITLNAEGFAPITISGGQALTSLDYTLPVASAQVKSGLLLAALYASGKSKITEPVYTRNHTERMLSGFGYEVETKGHTIEIEGGGKLSGTHIKIPADISSAAFFMVAASITPDSDILLENVSINATRTGIITILSLMGARISFGDIREYGFEKVTDIRVRYAELRGIDVPREQVPLAIDEFPAIMVAAACAKGMTVIRGAQELRHKECDRIEVMARALTQLGVVVDVREDGIVIEGGTGLTGGTVAAEGDHRIAMALALTGCISEGEVVVEDCDNVATSFPTFVAIAEHLGMSITQQTKDTVTNHE